MKLAKLSASYEYLYSPRSWLHFQNSEVKLTAVLVQLIYLPFISIKSILGHLFCLLIIQKSIKMPRSLKNYFRESLIVFSFFMLISIKKNNPCNSGEIYSRNILQIYLHSMATRHDILAAKAGDRSFFYLHVSTVRLIAIHLIYLFLIRHILLTTKHENILKVIMTRCKYSKKKLIFIIMTSLQFLKTIFGEIEIIRIAYILRGISISTINEKRVFFFILAFFLKQLLINIGACVSGITCTLYSKDIRYSTLNV